MGAESPTIEYKEQMTDTMARDVSGLGNTYAGLLLVGVSDDRVVGGVKEKTIESFSDHCAAKIEPPWVPRDRPCIARTGLGSVRLGHAWPATGAAMIREGHRAKPIQKDH